MAEMAGIIEEEFPWFSADLRILDAEYEKSKLRVFQDTLLCKRSMVELELLIKNERLQKNVRVNKKIRKHESQLQVPFMKHFNFRDHFVFDTYERFLRSLISPNHNGFRILKLKAS